MCSEYKIYTENLKQSNRLAQKSGITGTLSLNGYKYYMMDYQ
jgi:hypothetical protein